MEKIYSQHYIDLPRDIREHLAKVFGIVKTGPAQIRDTTVISDGTTNDDLAVITSEKMAEYVGSVAPFWRLWELTLAKVNYELHPPIDLSSLADIVDDSTHFITITDEDTNPKFCDFCDSKGIRHKANCTKPGVINGYEVKENA